jgi:hypothetical protein
VAVLLKLGAFLAIIVALLVYFSPRGSQQQQAVAPRTVASVTLAERTQAEQQLTERARLIAVEAAGRGAFPDRMDRRFRNEYRAATFGVSGENNTVLTIWQPQTAEAFTYKVGPWTDFLDACRAAGFRQVVVIDGSRSRRSFDLAPRTEQRLPSPPAPRSTG